MAAFFGGALMAVGALIAVLSGLCSGVFLVSTFQGSTGDLRGYAGIALLIGGLPFLFGLALFFIGRRIYRSANGADRRPPGGGPIPPT